MEFPKDLNPKARSIWNKIASDKNNAGKGQEFIRQLFQEQCEMAGYYPFAQPLHDNTFLRNFILWQRQLLVKEMDRFHALINFSRVTKVTHDYKVSTTGLVTIAAHVQFLPLLPSSPEPDTLRKAFIKGTNPYFISRHSGQGVQRQTLLRSPGTWLEVKLFNRGNIYLKYSIKCSQALFVPDEYKAARGSLSKFVEESIYKPVATFSRPMSMIKGSPYFFI